MSDSSGTWTFSQSFTPEFQAMRSELVSRVEAMKAQGSPSQESLQELSISMAKMTKALGDATGQIPSYDQKQYENQLKALEISIESFRTSTPKAKFAFKRRPPAQPQNQTVSVPLIAMSQPPGNAKPSIPAPSSSVMIFSQSNKYITRSSVGCEQTDMVISELDHCVVDLLEPSRGVSNELKVSALHVRNLTRCVLLLPPVAGSALLQDLTNCTVVLGCHQFRMHSSKNVDVFLSISSNPIIEHCERIRFAGYPSLLYPVALLDQDSYTFNVKDFSHIRSTPSPNLSMMPDEDVNAMNSKLSDLKEGSDLLAQISSVVPA